MDTGQCERLRQAYLQAAQRDIKVIVLMGGADYWSNGIHLNHIEAAESPADESWRNINAMNDLAQAIITNGRQFTIAALQANAGAGGVFLALAADVVYARETVILNPHYKSMGNLYGSEYWTYLLPKRVGRDKALSLTQNRLPINASTACATGLIDACFALDRAAFIRKIENLAEQFAHAPDYGARLQEKYSGAETMSGKNRCNITAIKNYAICSLTSTALIPAIMSHAIILCINCPTPGRHCIWRGTGRCGG